ncbi:hypothetical protein MTR67_035073 [Solanum verrucosum]|uniref:Uncharacterized protein n=1 Tax=Solanum verrucosum TaxID=315347 RepID=A0AAF0ZL44_SOLVR|nr:hypothetical protein MTR67_035073 [Solanum verrucosum]
MANHEIDEEKNPAIQLYWLIGALLVIFFAILLSSTLYDNRNTGKSCMCIQGVGKHSSGVLKKCCCDYRVVSQLNKEVLHPLLQELVKTPFFRYFKDPPPDSLSNSSIKSLAALELSKVVSSVASLKFGLQDDGKCHLRDCSICECPEKEFPEPFKAQSHQYSSSNLVCLEENPEGTVDRTIDSKTFKGWVEVDNPWTNDDETDNAEMTYVNLQLNPERYTGYSGPYAKRIWDAIYLDNCPQNYQNLLNLLFVTNLHYSVALYNVVDEEDLAFLNFTTSNFDKDLAGEICPEKNILYKLISGLHSSISIHIAADYLLDEALNTWGRNLTLMYDRVLKFPDRVDNLYFTFLFVLRAVTKAANYLDKASYDTGNPEDDLKTQSWIEQLVYHPKLKFACPLPFNEVRLWKGKGEPDLMQQIQKQFRNISALMDCIGCEKCRLWGKLQFLGLGTALKILFSVNSQEHLHKMFQFQQNEVIALINLLNRLLESVMLVHEMWPSLEKVMGKQVSTPSDQPSMTGGHV